MPLFSLASKWYHTHLSSTHGTPDDELETVAWLMKLTITKYERLHFWENGTHQLIRADIQQARTRKADSKNYAAKIKFRCISLIFRWYYSRTNITEPIRFTWVQTNGILGFSAVLFTSVKITREVPYHYHETWFRKWYRVKSDHDIIRSL